MHSIILLIIYICFFNPIMAVDNCNNNQSNKYLDDLFVAYQQTELKYKQRYYAQKILSFAALNKVSFNSVQLDVLKNAHELYGCAIFPCLLQKNKIHYNASSSPVQFLSYKNLREPIIAQIKDLQIKLEVLEDKDKVPEINQDLSSLQFTILKKNKKIAGFNRSIKGFSDVEIDTFFQDSVWYVLIYSYNAQMRNKALFSFYANGAYACQMVPLNFDKHTFCEAHKGIIGMSCDVRYCDLKGCSYDVAIQHCAEKQINVLEEITIAPMQFNPRHSMNIAAIEKKDCVLVWVDGNLFIRYLSTDQLYNLGKLNFSSVSKISFSNDGRIVWIEGYENNKDLSHSLIQAWDLKTKKRKRNWHSSITFVRNYTFSPNGVLALGIIASIYPCSFPCIIKMTKNEIKKFIQFPVNFLQFK